MSENEAQHGWDEYDEYESKEKARKRSWERLKEKSNIAKKTSTTALFIIFSIVVALAVDIAPLSDSVRFGVIESWQFRAICGICFLLVLYRIWSNSFALDHISFVELDERNRFEKPRYSAHYSSLDKFFSQIEKPVPANDEVSAKVEKSRKAISGHDFVEHMRSIIESLDYQIDYAEEKASRLLEVGRSFVKVGIWLYIFNIFVWQAYLYFIDFALTPGVVLGMVSSTMIFLIMEFLGAWYLKQYRHYGDSAFSYMKVRSSYNKYMLAYCAIYEFTIDDLSGAKVDMLKVLEEPEKWPDFKDVNSNDFNYMLQSVDSMGVVFEKLKGVFARNNGNGSHP